MDPQVRTPDGHAYDVVFVGTTKGKVLKMVVTADPRSGKAASATSLPSVLAEEMQLFPADTPVERLQVSWSSLENYRVFNCSSCALRFYSFNKLKLPKENL